MHQRLFGGRGSAPSCSGTFQCSPSYAAKFKRYGPGKGMSNGNVGKEDEIGREREGRERQERGKGESVPHPRHKSGCTTGQNH